MMFKLQSSTIEQFSPLFDAQIVDLHYIEERAWTCQSKYWNIFEQQFNNNFFQNSILFF